MAKRSCYHSARTLPLPRQKVSDWTVAADHALWFAGGAGGERNIRGSCPPLRYGLRLESAMPTDFATSRLLTRNVAFGKIASASMIQVI